MLILPYIEQDEPVQGVQARRAVGQRAQQETPRQDAEGVRDSGQDEAGRHRHALPRLRRQRRRASTGSRAARFPNDFHRRHVEHPPVRDGRDGRAVDEAGRAGVRPREGHDQARRPRGQRADAIRIVRRLGPHAREDSRQADASTPSSPPAARWSRTSITATDFEPSECVPGLRSTPGELANESDTPRRARWRSCPRWP